MLRSNAIMARFSAGAMFIAVFMLASVHAVRAEADDSNNTPQYSPSVNGAAVRGLSSIGSAESMGAGRLTFDFMPSWYKQQTGYATSPVAGASIFTGNVAASYGVNSNIDLFGSIAGFGSSSYTNTDNNSGLGTVRVGAQGSLPFTKNAFLRMGGLLELVGGTSLNQINTFRADGYDYFETRTGYDILGKLLQTVMFGNEDNGIKLHLNEAGVIGVNNEEPTLVLLGAGFEANMGMVVLGAELNSRTNFNDLAFGTDPLWFTPTIHLRTPYHMNVMAGVDVALSGTRSSSNPQALEPYRIFGALAFSYDLLANRRKAAFAQRQKAAQEKAALEAKSAQSAKDVQSLTRKSAADSLALANEKKNGSMQMDSMQRIAADNARANKATADDLARANKTSADDLARANKATADSLARKAIADSTEAANNLAYERSKRSDAERKLLSTGELLLDAVYFKTDETIISINSKPYLNIIGKMLAKYPKLQIEVAGHTDNVGGVAYNVTLSQGRAEAVRYYLTVVSPELNATLSAHGYGMSMPKADNTTVEGRLENRRVELRVINKDALLQYSQK